MEKLKTHSFLAMVMACIALPGIAQGGDIRSSESIAKDLVPTQPMTRSLGVYQVDPKPNGDAGASEVSYSGGGKTNLEVNFNFNSDQLTYDGMKQLRNLAEALNSEHLSGFRFIVVGHTDASGGREYNQVLSERRAAAVKSYLVGMHDIASERIDVLGRGEDELLLPSDPTNGKNRRVEVITR